MIFACSANDAHEPAAFKNGLISEPRVVLSQDNVLHNVLPNVLRTTPTPKRSASRRATIRPVVTPSFKRNSPTRSRRPATPSKRPVTAIRTPTKRGSPSKTSFPANILRYTCNEAAFDISSIVQSELATYAPSLRAQLRVSLALFDDKGFTASFNYLLSIGQGKLYARVFQNSTVTWRIVIRQAKSFMTPFLRTIGPSKFRTPVCSGPYAAVVTQSCGHLTFNITSYWLNTDIQQAWVEITMVGVNGITFSQTTELPPVSRLSGLGPREVRLSKVLSYLDELKETSWRVYVSARRADVDISRGVATYCQTQCKGLVNIALTPTNRRALIASNPFQDAYSQFASCQWLVTSPPHTNIQVKFISFDTRPGYDQVSVYDGPNTLGSPVRQLWGRLVGPVYVFVDGSTTYIDFEALGAFGIYKGFTAEITYTNTSGLVVLSTCNSVVFDFTRVWPPSSIAQYVQVNLSDNRGWTKTIIVPSDTSRASHWPAYIEESNYWLPSTNHIAARVFQRSIITYSYLTYSDQPYPFSVTTQTQTASQTGTFSTPACVGGPGSRYKVEVTYSTCGYIDIHMADYWTKTDIISSWVEYGTGASLQRVDVKPLIPYLGETSDISKVPTRSARRGDRWVLKATFRDDASQFTLANGTLSQGCNVTTDRTIVSDSSAGLYAKYVDCTTIEWWTACPNDGFYYGLFQLDGNQEGVTVFSYSENNSGGREFSLPPGFYHLQFYCNQQEGEPKWSMGETYFGVPAYNFNPSNCS